MRSFASKRFLYAIILSSVAIFLLASCFIFLRKPAFADNGADDDVLITEDDPDGIHYVTIFDRGTEKTVRTSAATVADVLQLASVVFSDTDSIEPSLDTRINSNDFRINIYRSHPVIISDGVKTVRLMTASYDMKTIAKEAGLTIYDGDDVSLENNANFLETGIATVYKITRNGGRTVTVDEEIPFTEETVRDYNLSSGTSEVRQLGEVGTKQSIYEVQYEDGREVSRVLVSETITREPVSRIVAIGAKRSIAPGQETCANWAREAGVSEDDLPVAMELIYHESGCRVDAENASSGAYGIPQALPGSKMASAGSDWKTNPVTQIRWMIGYVTGRYGGWKQAMDFWSTHRWY